MRTSIKNKRNKTYRFSSNEGKVTFYTETLVSTFNDGSVVTEEKFIREDAREYTNPSRRYTEFKNINSFNSAMSRIVKEGLLKI